MRRHALALLTAALLAGGCTPLGEGAYRTWLVDPPAAGDTVDFHGIPVGTGQIVLSEQGKAQSLFLGLMVERPGRFVHAGIVVVENGRPMLYEAQGRINVHFSGPPTDAVHGGIRRLSLDEFVRRQRFVAIFDPPPDVDRAQVAAFAQQARAEGRDFDPYFDLQDATRLYCTEFVARALEAGGAAPRRTTPRNANPSLGIVADWLKFRAPAIIPAAALVADARRVALLSARDTPAQVEAYFAMTTEIHRRFTADQRIGNVLTLSRLGGLGLRPEVQAFLARGNEEARDWDGLAAGEIEVRVQRLAAEMLGEFPAPQPRLARQ
jgi:hypothetical protein